MARGENPGIILTIPTTLTYDATQPFGHAQAGIDLCLEVIKSGGDAGKARLNEDGGKILGKFLSLDQNKVASYMVVGTPMLLRMSAEDSVTVGNKIVGAAASSVNGYCKNGGTDVDARGLVIEILQNAENGRFLVLMPA